MTPLRILVADDHEIVRIALRRLIELEPGWEVCAEASDGREAVTLAETLRPDVVVLDLSMPRLNGLEAARQIKQALPTTEVLIFTAEESEEIIHQVFEAGALGYILKSDLTGHLAAAIRALSEHKQYFTKSISEAFVARYLRDSGRGEQG